MTKGLQVKIQFQLMLNLVILFFLIIIIRYSFKTVTQFIDPIAKSIVSLTLYIEASRLTQNQADEVILKLGMLLPTGSQLKVRKWTEEQNSKRAQLHFFVDDNKNKTLPGPDVVSMLKAKLKQDSSLLQLSVDNIQTTVCQNNCSGWDKNNIF